MLVCEKSNKPTFSNDCHVLNSSCIMVQDPVFLLLIFGSGKMS